MALMTRADILAAPDIGYQDIDLSHIPGWGTVRVKDLTARERDQLEQTIVVERVETVKGKKVKSQELSENVRATFCAACMVDEGLQPLFSKSDVTALGEKSAKALDLIFAEIRSRNGIGDQDLAELEGNSVPSPVDASPTA
jgi:hypothetical protein